MHAQTETNELTHSSTSFFVAFRCLHTNIVDESAQIKYVFRFTRSRVARGSRNSRISTSMVMFGLVYSIASVAATATTTTSESTAANRNDNKILHVGFAIGMHRWNEYKNEGEKYYQHNVVEYIDLFLFGSLRAPAVSCSLIDSIKCVEHKILSQNNLCMWRKWRVT